MNSWLPPVAEYHGVGVEVGRALFVAASVLALFIAAERWKRRVSPPVEWTRKLVHVGSALLAAGFPWLFASAITVLCLAAGFAAVITITRKRGLLGSVHCVERRSEGGLHFLVAVCVLFAVGRDRPVFYLISLLVLMLADTSAALIGMAYGRRQYRVEADHRSLEGSLAFLGVAFLSVFLPLLLWTSLDFRVVLLVALQLAVLVTSVEAVSTRGIDNLLAPLATFYLLERMTRLSAGWIAGLLCGELVMLAALALVSLHSNLLTVSGVIAAHLFFFAVWTLGGAAWLVAPGLAFAAFVAVRLGARLRDRDLMPERHQVLAVLYVGLAGGVLFLVDNGLQTVMNVPAWLGARDLFYVPFVGALSGQLAILLMLQVERAGQRSFLQNPAAAGLFSLAVVAPASLCLGRGGPTLPAVAATAGICLGSICFYTLWRRGSRGNGTVLHDLRLQAASVTLATLLALPAHFWWIGLR